MDGLLQAKRKISGMLVEVAKEYLDLGETEQEKLNILRGALSAWNIACMKESARKNALKNYMRVFRKNNPGVPKEVALRLEDDLTLIVNPCFYPFPYCRR